MYFNSKRDWEGILVYYSNEKFGIRYPDGVEPSHTVVCYHKILFDADYLGRETPNLNKKSRKIKQTTNMKDYYFYIHIKTNGTT